MIKVTTPNNTVHYLASNAIARISEAAPSSQWHGIRAIVYTFDGRVIECSENASEIIAAIDSHGL